MIGRDNKEYTIDTAVSLNSKAKDIYFQVWDKESGKLTDEGWFVISKNGTIRVDRIK